MHKHIVTLLFALFAFLVFTQAIYGQEVSLLRWSDIEAAIDQHPALKQASAEIDASKAQIRLSRQYPNPEIGAAVGQGRANDESERALVWGIELEIPIDAPGVYLNATKAAKAGHHALEAEVRLRRLHIERELKTLFYAIAFGQERLRLLNENIARLKKLIMVARHRVTLGEARPMEAMRLEVELEKEKLERAGVIRQLTGDRERLNIWLGGTLPADYEIKFAWKAFPVLPSFDQKLERTLQNHPQMRAAAYRIEAAQAQTKAARHRLFPEMSIGGFYEQELDARSVGGMLSMALPLWNWNQGGIAKARAVERMAKYERNLKRRALQSSILKAHKRAEEALKRARRYREVIVPKARRIFDAVFAMYRVGETGLADLLDAEREQNRLETDMLAAFEEGWLAHLELITLFGGAND